MVCLENFLEKSINKIIGGINLLKRKNEGKSKIGEGEGKIQASSYEMKELWE